MKIIQGRTPKILLFDLETTPLEALTWGPKWEANLLEVKKETQILSYSAKWLSGKHTTKGQIDYKGYKGGKLDDKAVVKELWNLINEADMVVAHNGKSFDVKVANARFAFHSLAPPAPYRVIDTLTEAKKYLRLPSYFRRD